MKAIEPTLREKLGARLEYESQDAVMRDIPQFSEVETGNFAKEQEGSDSFHAMVFNIERGVHLAETIDFLKYSPDIRPLDIILANELDNGCLRSEGKNVALEIAKALEMNYAYSLEFIELANKDEPKGYHGNAVFSKYPIIWAETFRLPEENNWYFDRQKRIGGRCAVFVKVRIGTQEVGIVSIHLENRTDGAGRRRQLAAIMDEVDRVFPDIPVLLGGDLNTNTFDGRCVPAIAFLQTHRELLDQQIGSVEDYEPCLADAEKRGYDWKSASAGTDATGTPIPDQTPTRRKPVPSGSEILLRLDWLMARGLKAENGKTVSTLTSDCAFAPEGSALAAFSKKEISDHNAVWAKFTF